MNIQQISCKIDRKNMQRKKWCQEKCKIFVSLMLRMKSQIIVSSTLFLLYANHLFMCIQNAKIIRLNIFIVCSDSQCKSISWQWKKKYVLSWNSVFIFQTFHWRRFISLNSQQNTTKWACQVEVRTMNDAVWLIICKWCWKMERIHTFLVGLGFTNNRIEIHCFKRESWWKKKEECLKPAINIENVTEKRIWTTEEEKKTWIKREN